MDKMNINITITPQELTGYGNQLVTYAGDLTNVIDNINTLVGQITEGWSGLAEKAYYEMYEQLYNSLKSFPEMVSGLGQATKDAAEAFSQTDTSLQTAFSPQEG